MTIQESEFCVLIQLDCVKTEKIPLPYDSSSATKIYGFRLLTSAEHFPKIKVPLKCCIGVRTL